MEARTDTFPIDIPNFRIERLLGYGGMARVYIARQLQPERAVVVKLVSPDSVRTTDEDVLARVMEQLRREGDLAAQFAHPNLVTVHECGTIDGHYYLAMEYLPGGDLAARIREGLSEEEALSIAGQIAAALGEMHRSQMQHRDLKPENILFRESGQPVLTDFGIAKQGIDVSTLTAMGLRSGTPHYMSPEHATNAPMDGRSDLYSLGVVLYQMLTGELPFAGNTPIAIGRAHLEEPVPRLPDSLIRFQPLIDRLLAKRPQDRYQNAEEVVAAIDALAGGGTPTVPQTPTQQTPTQPPPATGAFEELRRRKIFRAAAWYGGAGWLVTELLTTLAESYQAPATVSIAIVLAFLAGFPVALALAWYFDLQGGRIQRTPGQSSRSVLAGMLLVSLTISAGLWFAWEAARRGPEDTVGPDVSDRSLAVMPVLDLGEQDDALAERLTRELIRTLRDTDHFVMAGEESSLWFKGRSSDAAAVGRMLDVRHILAASLRRDASTVRIHLLLVNSEGVTIWENTMESAPDAFDALPRRIARDLVQVFGLDLDATSQRQLARESQTSMVVLELLARAHRLQQPRDVAGLEKAAALVEQALEMDPDYAPGWVDLAMARYLLGAYGKAGYESNAVRAALIRAKDLGDNSAQYHQLVGVLLRQEIRRQGETPERKAQMLAAFDRALARSDGAVGALSLAIYHRVNGELDRAAELLRQALVRDPLHRAHNYQYNRVLVLQGNVDDAAKNGEELIQWYPDFTPAYAELAAVYAAQHRYVDSVQVLEQAPQQGRNAEFDYRIAWGYLALGEFEAAARRYAANQVPWAKLVACRISPADDCLRLANQLLDSTPTPSRLLYEEAALTAIASDALEQALAWMQSGFPGLSVEAPISTPDLRPAILTAGLMARLDRNAEAQALLSRASGLLERPSALAVLFDAYGGDREAAIRGFQDLVEGGWRGWYYDFELKTGLPLVKDLADDPAFQRAVRRLEHDLEEQRRKLAEAVDHT